MTPDEAGSLDRRNSAALVPAYNQHPGDPQERRRQTRLWSPSLRRVVRPLYLAAISRLRRHVGRPPGSVRWAECTVGFIVVDDLARGGIDFDRAVDGRRLVSRQEQFHRRAGVIEVRHRRPAATTGETGPVLARDVRQSAN